MIISILDLFILVLIIFICTNVKITKTINIDNYLIIDKTTILRGFLSIAIIFHHISHNINDKGIIFSYFSIIGVLIVSTFLFLSGYGITISFLQKRKYYLNYFWEKRILYIFIVYLIATIIYWSYKSIFLNSIIPIKTILISIIDLKPIVDYSWYIIIQMILYIIWWGIYYTFKNKTKRICFVFLGVIILIILLIYFNYPNYTWISNFSFFIGILWAEYKQFIDKFIIKNYKKCLFFVISTLLISFLLSHVFDHFHLKKIILSNFLSFYASSIFSVFVIILLMKIQYKERLQKIFKFIGERSLETYLIHGMFIHFCNKYSFFPQNYIYTMQVLILTILIACLLYYIDKKIKFLLN